MASIPPHLRESPLFEFVNDNDAFDESIDPSEYEDGGVKLIDPKIVPLTSENFMTCLSQCDRFMIKLPFPIELYICCLQDQKDALEKFNKHMKTTNDSWFIGPLLQQVKDKYGKKHEIYRSFLSVCRRDKKIKIDAAEKLNTAIAIEKVYSRPFDISMMFCIPREISNNFERSFLWYIENGITEDNFGRIIENAVRFHDIYFVNYLVLLKPEAQYPFIMHILIYSVNEWNFLTFLHARKCNIVKFRKSFDKCCNSIFFQNLGRIAASFEDNSLIEFFYEDFGMK